MAELRVIHLPWKEAVYTSGPIANSVQPCINQMVIPEIPVYPLPLSANDFVIPATHLEKDDEGNICTLPNHRNMPKERATGAKEGTHYLVQGGKLLGKGSREGQKFPVSDAFLESVIARKVFTDLDGVRHVRYLFKVISHKWKEPREIEVADKDVRRVFHKIHEVYPEISLFQKGADALEEMIADVFDASKGTMRTEYGYEKSGWYEEDGGSAAYFRGTHASYRDWNIPDTTSWLAHKRKDVFLAGLNFLKVGRRGKEIYIIFLFSHVGFTIFWFKKAGFKVEFFVYVVGQNGSLKTAVLVVVSDPFEVNTSNRKIQLTDSSWPSIRQRLLLAQDSSVLLDDYSKTQRAIAKASDESFEKFVRAIGNGKLSDRKKPGGIGDQSTDIRTSPFGSGEDDPSLGESSFRRIHTVRVDRSTFDGAALAEFQENPTILAEYFALYVEFLAQNPEYVVNTIQSARAEYQANVAQLTAEPRLRENALAFFAQARLVTAFGIWCGVDKQEMRNFLSEAEDSISASIRDNDATRKQVRPDVLFVQSVWKQVMNGNKYLLAESGAEYHQAKRPFCVGFADDDNGFFWLKMEVAMDAAREYCGKHGLFLTDNEMVIKGSLFTHGILAKPEKGWVWRWTQGLSRERFVKLFINKVDEIIKGDDF